MALVQYIVGLGQPNGVGIFEKYRAHVQDVDPNGVVDSKSVRVRDFETEFEAQQWVNKEMGKEIYPSPPKK